VARAGGSRHVAPDSPPQPVGIARRHHGLFDDVVLLDFLDVLLRRRGREDEEEKQIQEWRGRRRKRKR